MQMIHKMLDWFKSLFWKEEMELTLVGLQHAGECYHCYNYAFEIIIMHEINRENNICKCDRLWLIQRRHDTHSGLQHEEDNQRKRDDKALGYWWTTEVTPRIVILGLILCLKVPLHVGEVLPRGERHRVHGGRRGS